VCVCVYFVTIFRRGKMKVKGNTKRIAQYIFEALRFLFLFFRTTFQSKDVLRLAVVSEAIR
jgi:hypothetical protein